VADDAVAGAGDDVIGKRPPNDHYVSQKQAFERRYSNQGVHGKMRYVKRIRAGKTDAEITKKLTKQVDEMLLPGKPGEVFIPNETLPSAKYMRSLEKVLDWH